MPSLKPGPSTRLRREERLWKGAFGDSYLQRNSKFPDRSEFWTEFVRKHRIAGNILEVGCGVGFNLVPLGQAAPKANIWGVDVNERAVKTLHSTYPGFNGGWATIFDLPFKDGWFDLVYTVGLLIHIHPNNLEDAIRELRRVTRKYLLVAEYFAEDWMEIPYHGTRKSLYKGPYGAYTSFVTGKRPIEEGFLSKDTGFDRVNWWLWKFD